MKKFVFSLASILSILGCVMGAGFISGAEINSFFLRFGLLGILGVVLSALIFVIVIYFVIKKVSNKTTKMQKNNKYVDFLPFCQIFISGAMVAGLIDILNMFGLKKIYCFVIVFVCLFVGLVVGIKSANFTNIVVSLCLLILLPFVIKQAGKLCFDSNLTLSFGSFLPAILFAIFYVAMNTVASIEVIKHAGKNKVSAIGVAAGSGVIFCVLALIIMCIISGAGAASDMPMLSVINLPWLKVMYCMLFVVAMLSTLLSSSMGVKKIFKSGENTFNSFCTTCTIFIVGLIGFNNIVLYVYPMVGAAMVLQIAINKIKSKKVENKFAV